MNAVHSLKFYLSSYLESRRLRRVFARESFPFYQISENIKQLEESLLHLQEMQSPHDKIEHIPGSQWSSDTWAFETCLCLRSPLKYNTPLAENYGFHPYRAKFLNILCIYKSFDGKLRMHKNICRVAEMSDNLFICAVGRGLDFFLALTAKSD
jgi:hypothetical protein